MRVTRIVTPQDTTLPAARWLAIGATLAIVMMTTGWAARPAAQRSSPAPKVSRIDRLEAWIAGVKRHEPGTFDDVAQEISEWGDEELKQVWIDMSSVVTLVYEPRTAVFYIPRTRQNPTSGWVPYSDVERQELRDIATPLGEGHESRLLKRGALLHADIAMLAPQEKRATGVDGPIRYRLRSEDGRPVDFYAAVSHWEMGRRLLDRVRTREKRGAPLRGPERDEGVRLWHLAAMSHMIQIGDLDFVEFETASGMFPDDPQVLFMCASLQEVNAGAMRQAAFRSASVPGNVKFDVRSRGEQLLRAEDLYRRALEAAKDSFDEARIRYARVLGQRGRHAAAVAQLQKVQPVEPLLEYYAALFLGGELEALGRDDEARRPYERARDLYPAAQSPRLALSRLAPTEAERTDTRAALLSVLGQPLARGMRDDPFWIYDSAPGRNTDRVFKQLHLLLAREGL
jgi:tetratricopeptide (TPR) repeat protein